MDIYLTKCMDSLQEVFIHPPPPPNLCEECFIMDACILFHVYWTVDKKHPLTPPHYKAWRGQDNFFI